MAKYKTKIYFCQVILIENWDLGVGNWGPKESAKWNDERPDGAGAIDERRTDSPFANFASWRETALFHAKPAKFAKGLKV